MSSELRAVVRGLRVFVGASIVFSAPYFLQIIQDIITALQNDTVITFIDLSQWGYKILTSFVIGILMMLDKYIRDTK